MSYHKITSFLLFLLISTSIFYLPINDTDETYGYWEPLHYLLENRGMKTWEYDESYGLRSYAFLLPFAFIIRIFSPIFDFLNTNIYPIYNIWNKKIILFYFLRFIISSIASYSLNSFIYSLYCRVFFQEHFIAILTLLFFYSSHGILISSVSFLPSSFAMIFFLLSISAWLEDKKFFSIFYGCLCVLYTGWPFSAVLFVPIGCHMIYTSLTSPLKSTFILPNKDKKDINTNNNNKNENEIIQERNKLAKQIFNNSSSSSSSSSSSISLITRILSLISLIFNGIFILLFVLSIVYSFDSFYYGKKLFPSYNIIYYNIFGENNDHLYGIDTNNYYIKNLLLNFNIIFIFFLLFPFIYFFNFLYNQKDQWGNGSYSITLIITIYLWLAILFNRDHKEERFLFPIYPLICYLGSLFYCSLYQFIIKLFYPNSFQSLPYKYFTYFSSLFSTSPSSSSSSSDINFKKGKFFYIFLLLIFLLSFFINLLRNFAVSRNYSGYLSGWKDFSYYLTQQKLNNNNGNNKELNICMGNEWYTFPSHFFLPSHAKLAYISDEFHGILPQLYQENKNFNEKLNENFYYFNHDGTRLKSLLKNNNQNQEEIDRYIPLSSCDYLVTSDKKYEDILNNNNNKISIVVSKKIIDPLNTKTLYRAYYIPFTSSSIVYKNYNFYKLK